jgi:hypothetical protein
LHTAIFLRRCIIEKPTSQIIYFPKSFAPNIKVNRNKTIKMKNNTLAMDAAPAAMPVKPKIAAMIAITIKITAHLSIISIFNKRIEIKNVPVVI